jgi:hypothetical protein
MNPLRWKREHQVAWFVICLIGAIVGLLFAWFQSPFYYISRASLSGEWANSTRVFLNWLPYVELYWPWPMFGAIIPGLAFYAFQLLVSPKPGGEQAIGGAADRRHAGAASEAVAAGGQEAPPRDSSDDAAEVVRLAALPPPAYERKRRPTSHIASRKPTGWLGLFLWFWFYRGLVNGGIDPFSLTRVLVACQFRHRSRAIMDAWPAHSWPADG